MRRLLVATFCLIAPCAAFAQSVTCAVDPAQQWRFVNDRIATVLLLAPDEAAASDAWAQTFAARSAENIRKLEIACASRPQAPLWKVFSELFGSD